MKRPRFICAVALHARLSPDTVQRVERAARAVGAKKLSTRGDSILAVSGERPQEIPMPDGGRAVILGKIFRKDRSGAVRQFRPEELDAIAAGHGAELFRSFWGDYLAFLGGARRFDILRAPFGERPASWFRTADALVAASDLEILADCGADLRAVDWREISRHLAEPDVRRDRTCLTEIGELRGGSRLSICDGAVTLTNLWTPWNDHREGTFDPADLRGIIDRCVADKLGQREHPLLLLSGGLDSSILAAAISRSGKKLSACNLVTRDSAGDERRYARTAASQFDIPYFEAVRDIANVDPFASAARWLARPALRSFLQDSAALTEALAARESCDVLVEGSGGDNVFCSLQSVAPVADRIRVGSSFGEVLNSARDIAQLTDAVIAAVLLRAVYRAWFRRDPYRVRPDHTFLSAQAVAASQGAVSHPWLDCGQHALPGKVGHAAMLVAAQGWAECLDPLTAVPTVGPLLAQPIVEACFAVPSWAWFQHGQNRVPAREAYRGILPDSLLDRRSKATPDCFVTQLFEFHRAELAEFLLEGHLSRAGLLDRATLGEVLRREGPTRDHAHYRIMRIADVEAWLADRPT